MPDFSLCSGNTLQTCLLLVLIRWGFLALGTLQQNVHCRESPPLKVNSDSPAHLASPWAPFLFNMWYSDKQKKQKQKRRVVCMFYIHCTLKDLKIFVWLFQCILTALCKENSLHVVVLNLMVYFWKTRECGTPAFKQPVKVFSYRLGN